eukprot:CAMPEP_0181101868 /NCGR_PEP_ID=MMETSP1071-20121207/13997_1 /TAXON_ID=35127 /ORGANISM="Thalassiosira sp., Strain NH16" /LENGTH=443 /DNA_ID=CAMNT_0023184775 /DNA_START=82 /DNA_END=1413 /DNA_ORIENTATION=-
MALLKIIPAIILIGATLFQIRLSTLGLSPISFDLPDLPSLDADDRLAGVAIEKIGEGDLLYPEAFVLPPSEQYVFASLGDGRIVRINRPKSQDDLTWHTLVRTGNDKPGCGKGGPADDTASEPVCGRPLGLWMAKRESVDPNFTLDEADDATDGNSETGRREDTDVILVADAYKGFIMVTHIYGYESEMHTLATRAVTDPPDYKFSLLNAVVQIPSNGDVYLTETSQTFQRRRIFHAAMDGNPTGRLLRYRRETGIVEVVADKLYMANGIALSHDEKSLLIVGGVRVLRFNLASQTMDPNPFVEAMPGTGDNIKAMDQLPNGKRVKCYWAALGGKYTKPFSLLKFVSDKPWLRAVLLALIPYRQIIDLVPKWTALAVYDEQGKLIETLRDDGAMDENGNKVAVTVPWVSEMEPVGDYIYIASWYNPFLARIKRHDMGFKSITF